MNGSTPRSSKLGSAALILPIAAVIAVTFVAHRAIERGNESNEWLLHTQEVLTTLQTALATAVDAETGVRGYLILGELESLEPFDRSESAMPSVVDRLAALTADDPVQQRRVANLRTQLANVRASLAALIEMERRGLTFDPATHRRENAEMDALRTTITAMCDEELRLLADREKADAQAVRRVYATGVAVVAMTVAFLAWAYILLARDASRRRQTAETMRRANEELEERVASRTTELADANARLTASLAEAQRARRETEAASRLKDEFLMTVSHELRTPLTAIRGWARMLITGEIRDEQKHHALETIERNAQAQTQLIGDLLDVSRAISGKLRLDVSIVNLPDIVKGAVESIQPAADAKEIRVETIVDPDAGPVSGDAARLQQIVWNLLTNAVKFTPKRGRVQVRVECANAHVDVVVSDTGAGISEEFLPHVFERFRQEDAGTTRSHGGLGLGLAIVRHLAELHGGTVTAESRGAGAGATFTVRLPLTSDRHDEIDSAHVSPVIDAPGNALTLARLDDVRILVVDDEAQASEMFATILERAGATVVTAASAQEALILLQGHSPDVLLSDIEMPSEDGYSLVQKARALDRSRSGRLLAIAVTAYARPEDRRQSLQAGFDGHVTKPVDPFELVSAIATLVASQSPTAT